jgi:hypothetical protein
VRDTVHFLEDIFRLSIFFNKGVYFKIIFSSWKLYWKKEVLGLCGFFKTLCLYGEARNIVKELKIHLGNSTFFL